MTKMFLPFLILILGACNSQPDKSPSRAFEDTHLFFDLENEVEKVPCAITGETPSWLSGTLLRNGPAKFQVGTRRVDWFDGLAMLHAFQFSSEQVFYTNRFLRKQSLQVQSFDCLDFLSLIAQHPQNFVF